MFFLFIPLLPHFDSSLYFGELRFESEAFHSIDLAVFWCGNLLIFQGQLESQKWPPFPKWRLIEFKFLSSNSLMTSVCFLFLEPKSKTMATLRSKRDSITWKRVARSARELRMSASKLRELRLKSWRESRLWELLTNIRLTFLRRKFFEQPPTTIQTILLANEHLLNTVNF